MLTDADVIAVKRNTTHELTAPLSSWTRIDSLQNASGIGYYTSTFQWPPASGSNDSIGAYVKLPPLLHTAKLLVNGAVMSPLDHADPVVDISSVLRMSSNTVEIRAPTTMWNYLRSLGDQLQSSDGPPLRITSTGLSFPLPPLTEINGLVGTIEIMPYTRLALS